MFYSGKTESSHVYNHVVSVHGKICWFVPNNFCEDGEVLEMMTLTQHVVDTLQWVSVSYGQVHGEVGQLLEDWDMF